MYLSRHQLHGRLVLKTVNRAPIAGAEGFDTICNCRDSFTACRLCRLEPWHMPLPYGHLLHPRPTLAALKRYCLTKMFSLNHIQHHYAFFVTLTYTTHIISSTATTLSPLDLWTDHAGVTALLARWTDKLAGGPEAGRSDSPPARVMGVGRQQHD